MASVHKAPAINESLDLLEGSHLVSPLRDPNKQIADAPSNSLPGSKGNVSRDIFGAVNREIDTFLKENTPATLVVDPELPPTAGVETISGLFEPFDGKRWWTSWRVPGHSARCRMPTRT